MRFSKHSSGIGKFLKPVPIIALLIFAITILPAQTGSGQKIGGAWEGLLRVSGVQLRLVFHIQEDQNGRFSATMDSPDQGANGIPVTAVSLDGDAINLEIQSIAGSYSGIINREEQSITCSWQQGGQKFPLALYRQKASAAPTTSTLSEVQFQKIAGSWQGMLDVGAIELKLVYHLKKDADGNLNATLDSPYQGAIGIPVKTVTVDGNSVYLHSPAIGGAFTGKISADGNQLQGTWEQNNNRFPLILDRSEENTADSSPDRPQNPRAPFPYTAEEVSFKNSSAGITLAGTLTLPKGAGPHPAVVLISGSGPQDRDETLLGHRPFLVLADHLTRQGIAVLRYDDRGTAQSGGDFSSATSEDFADDALAAVSFLKQRTDIDPKNIGLAGHSEGGLIAPMVANRSATVSFIVMLAGTGIPGTEILYGQTDKIMSASGIDPELIALNRPYLSGLFNIIREEANDSIASSRIRAFHKNSWENYSPAIQEKLRKIQDPEQALENTLKAFLSPWFRYFLFYDPQPALSKLQVPVLAVIGEKDTQVLPEDNLPVIRRALANSKVKGNRVLELPGLNHLFQTADSGAPAEYARIEETFSPTALQLISDWIKREALR